MVKQWNCQSNDETMELSISNKQNKTERTPIITVANCLNFLKEQPATHIQSLITKFNDIRKFFNE